MQDFRVLRFLGKLYRGLAILGLVLGTIWLTLIASKADNHTPIAWGELGYVLGVTCVQFVVFYGFSEAVELLFELREQGARAVRLLRKLQPEPEPDTEEAAAIETLGPYYKGRKR